MHENNLVTQTSDGWTATVAPALTEDTAAIVDERKTSDEWVES